VTEDEVTFEVFRSRRRQWVRALHLPSRRRTAWREIAEWASEIRDDLLRELRGLVEA